MKSFRRGQGYDPREQPNNPLLICNLWIKTEILNKIWNVKLELELRLKRKKKEKYENKEMKRQNWDEIKTIEKKPEIKEI